MVKCLGLTESRLRTFLGGDIQEESMFGLFRKKMTLDHASRKLADRITSYDPQSEEMFAQEPVFVAFFAVFFCLKFTKQRSWQERGRDIFDRLTLTLKDHLNASFPSDILNAQKIQERIRLYSLAIEISSDNPSPANVAHEIGVTFAMMHGEENNDTLVRKGSDIFIEETEAMFDLFTQYVLVM